MSPATTTHTRHSRDQYYVVGEGIFRMNPDGTASLTESVTAPPNEFSFSRIGPRGTALDNALAEAVAVAMTGVPQQVEDTSLPAGYTYLGQFVDHDLTRMTSTNGNLVSQRSPLLDLDVLYGDGPGGQQHGSLYNGIRLRLGTTQASPTNNVPNAGNDLEGFDLPRNAAGATPAEKQLALIPDLRNDENLIVAQTHLAFMRFHNRVADTFGPRATFKNVRAKVVKHYQWNRVFKSPGPDVLAPGSLGLLFSFSGTSGTLQPPHHRLPTNWVADFRRLFRFSAAGRPDLAVPDSEFNPAMRIDASMVDPLRNLPAGSFGPPNVPAPPAIERNLAFRNLRRANMVELASGQQMANMMGFPALNAEQILRGAGGATPDFSTLTIAQKTELTTNTPLWLYILREAEINGGKLTGVGGRIVAEVFHRAIEASRDSILRDKRFRPTLGPNRSTFRMTDLLLFAYEGEADSLNPMG